MTVVPLHEIENGVNFNSSSVELSESIALALKIMGERYPEIAADCNAIAWELRSGHHFRFMQEKSQAAAMYIRCTAKMGKLREARLSVWSAGYWAAAAMYSDDRGFHHCLRQAWWAVNNASDRLGGGNQ